jgi:cell division protein FtsN
MSHDFAKNKKKKKPAAKKATSGLPAWFWMFTGIITGLFIAFLIYLSTLQFNKGDVENFESEANELSKQIKEQADRMREGKEAIKKPKFEFYQRLPELKIETPKPTKTTIKDEDKKSYILQAGSFRSYQDADSLKALLIMQGLDVQINSVKDSKGNDWHRVQVGPYQTQYRLNKAQDVLANNNIPSMLIEVK